MYTIKHYQHDQINNDGVLRVEEIKIAYEISVRNPEWKILVKYKDIYRKITLRWILMSSLFCVVMQRMLVANYRRFGKAYRCPLQGSNIPSVRSSSLKQSVIIIFNIQAVHGLLEY